MATQHDVAEAGDPRLADYVGLTDVALRTASEVAHGLFIAEGELVVVRAVEAGYAPRSVLLSQRRARLLGPELRGVLDARPDLPVFVGRDDLLTAVTGFHVHRGVLASFARRPLPDPAGLLSRCRRVLVLEEVNTHTNVGVVIRSAAALGFEAVLLDPRSADPLYRRSVRVSMGAALSVPHARLSPLPEGLDVVKAAGFRIVALTPAGDVDLDELRPGAGDRLALLLGAEGAGLTPAALAAADLRVRIPMAGGVDSLNVGAAAAVACWALRAR
ncbi:MAG TPA: RNA methyltransferase [Mycobacteriales bacterium]|nr:RNA methyltransferase [Mycobacteriales bacterium]